MRAASSSWKNFDNHTRVFHVIFDQLSYTCKERLDPDYVPVTLLVEAVDSLVSVEVYSALNDLHTWVTVDVIHIPVHLAITGTLLGVV